MLLSGVITPLLMGGEGSISRNMVLDSTWVKHCSHVLWAEERDQKWGWLPAWLLSSSVLSKGMQDFPFPPVPSHFWVPLKVRMAEAAVEHTVSLFPPGGEKGNFRSFHQSDGVT